MPHHPPGVVVDRFPLRAQDAGDAAAQHEADVERGRHAVGDQGVDGGLGGGAIVRLDTGQEARHRCRGQARGHPEQPLHLGRPRDDVGGRIPGPVTEAGDALRVFQARLAALQVVDGVLHPQHLPHAVGQQRRGRGADAEVGDPGLEAALDHAGVVHRDEQQHRCLGAAGRCPQRPAGAQGLALAGAIGVEHDHLGRQFAWQDRRVVARNDDVVPGGAQRRFERRTHVAADREDQAGLRRLPARMGHDRTIGRKGGPA